MWIGIGNTILRCGGGGVNWTAYWATLISATVETTNPTKVVMTFSTANVDLIVTDFTITNWVISTLTRDATNKILTLTVHKPVVYGDSLTITFVKTGGTVVVTNNVAMEAELTTYITGLVTPLSAGQKNKISRLISRLKVGLGITDLDDAFDTMYYRGNSTPESSLRNLVKNAHHSTLAGTPNPTHVALEGFTSDGANGYINHHYDPSSEAVNFAQTSASVFCYIRTDVNEVSIDISCWRASVPTGVEILLLSDILYAYVNNAGQTGLARPDTRGFYFAVRGDVNDISYFINGGSKTTEARPLVSIPVGNMGELCRLDNGIPSLFSTKQGSFSGTGKYFSDAHVRVISDAVRELMRANNKDVTLYDRVLILGNSFTIIDPPDNIIWWGTWGMAATIAENDYAHQLENMIQVRTPHCVVTSKNIAAWELAHTTYDKANFDAYFASIPDCVILDIGENVTDETGFATSIQNLINYVKSKAPDTRIIICGTFWGDFSMETFLQDAATANGLTYVSLSALNIPANRANIGDTVQGDDSLPHLINNSGVALHPNDTGHNLIAVEIYNAL